MGDLLACSLRCKSANTEAAMNAQTKKHTNEPAGPALHMSAVLQAPVLTDEATIQEYVPAKIRQTRWWGQTDDEQKATIIRSVIFLKMKGMSDADVARIRPAVFRMFLWGKIDKNPPTVPAPVQQRQPRNRVLREKIERLKTEKEFEDFTREELVAFATHDELTGLANRHAYEMARKKPVVAFADLEGLKWINDNIGHEAGDKLLIAVADILSAAGLDTYRLGKGADEFIAQFDTVNEADHAMWQVNEELKRTLIQTGGRSVRGFQLSWGIGPDVESADQKMNAAKAELQEAGLRAQRGQRPAMLQDVAERTPVSLAPAPAEKRDAYPNVIELRAETATLIGRAPALRPLQASARKSA
jgi:diguanylate cyclase (GGDEF)-like protein